MRRRVSIAALCLAWLSANGAIWDVVQVVAWAKMFHDYAQVMPAAQALQVTFDGSAPCDLCHIAREAQDTAHEQLPRDEVLGGGTEKLLLMAETAPTFVPAAPDSTWPAVADGAGLTRTEPVPVRPPRV